VHGKTVSVIPAKEEIHVAFSMGKTKQIPRFARNDNLRIASGLLKLKIGLVLS